MKTSRFTKTLAASLMMTLTVSFTATTPASAAESGASQLKKLMSSHAWTGSRVSQAAKNATGDPGIQVIDRRYSFGEIYRCSYMNQQGRRIMVCD